ncbi:MAG: nucleotidyltransferase domain-containing protein [Desulfuromonas sp.]|nr:nucleotidyltransferase domain-containing protein [Desulfuromonas sp.]
MKSIGLGDVLFSKTQRRIFSLMFGTPERSYYLNEIVRTAGIGVGTVQRELAKLSDTGLLTVQKVGNQKHYQANPAAPIFDELCAIVRKTFGLGDELRKALSGLAEQIEVALIYGSVAQGSDTASSDIDVLIISDKLSYGQLFNVFSAAEEKLGRTISPTLYSCKEWHEKLHSNNNFVQKVLERPKIFLIGSEHDLGKFA